MAGKFGCFSMMLIVLCILNLSCGGCMAETAAQKNNQPASQGVPKAPTQAAPAPKATAQPASQATAELTSEDLNNQPAQLALFVSFLNKCGYKHYAMRNEAEEQVITYKVKDQKTSEIMNYAIVYNPKSQLLRIEAFDLADIPVDKNKLNLLYQKITEVNSVRTVGKFCIDPAKKKVRYIYYRTVLGGICYADFKTTLSIIEFIVINDLKQIKELKPRS